MKLPDQQSMWIWIKPLKNLRFIMNHSAWSIFKYDLLKHHLQKYTQPYLPYYPGPTIWHRHNPLPIRSLYLKQEWVRIYPAHIVKVNVYSSPMTTAYMNIPQFRANTSFSLPPFQFTTVHLFDSCLILCRQALRVYWFVIPHYQQLTLSSVADQRHPLAVLHDK